MIRRKRRPAGRTTFHDVVYGEITVDNEELDDQIRHQIRRATHL